MEGISHPLLPEVPYEIFSQASSSQGLELVSIHKRKLTECVLPLTHGG